MLKLIVLVLNVLVIRGGVAQIIQNGQCDPNVNLENNFNIQDFAGTWYEMRRSDVEVRGSDCSRFLFDVTQNGIQVQISAVNANFGEEKSGTATLASGTAKLTVDLSTPSQPFDFWILLTDYNNFAVAYNCENISPQQRKINVWQLGRSTNPLNTMMTALIDTTLSNSLGVNANQLRNVEHTEDACYILPIIEPGSPIVLPGVCDENINIVRNFDLEKFLGVWHEIASYVSENSQNTCSRAEYTLGNGFVQVENSQVIGTDLFSIFGTAVLDSADGSANLTVTLNVGNEQVVRNLRILATDYTSYALSYSCENLPNDSKRVYSWILSRSRRLSDTAQQAVNQVIQSEIVLNNQFYIQADQSDEACFYYPEYAPNTPMVFRGLCDMNIPVVQNFDAERYTGVWHDVESYYSEFQTGTCRNAGYRLLTDYVEVVNTQVIDQSLDSIIGNAKASPDGSGKLEVVFPGVGGDSQVSASYWVLATDYISYSLVYSCRNLNEDERQVWTWKLSRTKQLTQVASDAIDQVMNSIPVLDQRYYQKVDQSESGCFYFPEPRPGLPVVFPGKCDNNVQVMQNFDLASFAGLWHEVESYPYGQAGECINHQGVQAGNTLTVTSSQVDDQFLVTSAGTMKFSSTDGSAKMDIDIVVGGQSTTIPFWILATNYNDYALAYSCVQINEDYRQIYSWKLSRNKQLSASGQTAINSAVSQVAVLSQQYFEAVDQSDEACFFLPDLAQGEPVVLVGQCDPDIKPVANFEAGRYLGEWHLIESYPSDFQSGTCGRADYSIRPDGVVDVLNSQVIDEKLFTVKGTAVASTDGTGKLLVSFPDTTSPAEYLILGTDYDSYALVYSCRNIGPDQRRVWSWKLSRTNSLSSNANTAINAIVSSINVLNNRYYYQMDHTDQGCFYFPEPEPGKPVEFRGKCDMNIPVMPNFDVDRYVGFWHNIEMYPSRFQGGSCSNAMYSPGVGGITVVNSQVVDQRLDSISGTAVVDASGRLVVTFPIQGSNELATLPLWVLDTDYTSYSLVYACEDSGDTRKVWSWKLGRMKSLSQSATDKITAAMSSVQVLQNQYFEAVDQSAAGCFYHPQPQPGVPVRYPGSCSANIPVVANFNFNAFQGTWYEISAYPTGDDLGECTRHEYSGSGNTLALRYSNVQKLSLDILDGSLSLAPGNNNNDGRLVVNIAGVQVPFWVLDVDYNDYAIVYGCVDVQSTNLDSQFRNVYSWKLSRTRQLSQPATAAISTVISSVDVLRDEFFELVDHSADACFYLPEVPSEQVVVFPGQCDPNIEVVKNFNATEYLGRWYLIETYPSDFQGGSCNDARYTLGSGGVVDVLNTQVVNQQLLSVVGTATAASDGTGKLLVNFPDSAGLSDYWILDTDYSSYSLVYSCRNVDSDKRAVWSWKLSRSQSLSDEAEKAIAEQVNKINVLDERYFQRIDHSPQGCFYFPEPNQKPVLFRGKCDPDIKVVSDFKAAEYLGLWHMIETYPSSFQLGTCANAQYSLGDDGVDVLNSQVIDRGLDTMAGVAVIAYPDGSGILNVSFPIAGTDQFTQTPYWILRTDYNSFALVYSCVEVEEYKQVYSWKLSRTKQLSQAAVDIINEATSQIQVLDERYYMKMDQSPEGCFYFPEHEAGKPVVFPGQCEDINVVQNFNLEAFQGIWHEIEAYPKDQQQGHCVNHKYSFAGGNTLGLESSQVIEQTLVVTDGTMKFTSTDGSAKMSIDINAGGQVVTIPFWIVNTDYSDYALAYSCVNQNSDYRSVYSWKLSRRKSLSDNGRNAINNAMQSVSVIDNRYFEPIDQSDDACFYLPDLQPGEPAVFPGQCEDLPVVQNFDAARYLGPWRMIESYTSEFQSGSCNEADYSLASDGSVDVLNTQVVDEALLSVTGSAVLETPGVGKLLVTFPDSPAGQSTYWILDTDYDSYSLVYSCRNIGPEQRRVWSWKLSRSRSLSDEAKEAIAEQVNKVNVLNERYFQRIDHSPQGCFYFPEPNQKPVLFRGKCDPDIKVVSNFNAAEYLGLWHMIETYPSSFQLGTCANAQYSLGDDGVDVLNSQVIDRGLDTMAGVAVIAYPDGSGILNVSFPIAGTDRFTQTPYWILRTDYSSYALVYSCVEVEEYKQVYSWKLSRTKQLSQTAVDIINEATSQIQVLDERYYMKMDQSPEGCFYFPEHEAGKPVVFPGQCEDINVVQNFNLEAFQGIWHEIEAYPKDQQQGHCVNHKYSFAGGNTLGLESSQVIEQTLVLTDGTMKFTSTDGSGKMSIDINAGGQVVTIPFWIVNTDYNDYALAYSCVNQNQDYRSVYSWKLSRTKSLSDSGRNAINNAMQSVSVLDDRYFEPIDQSDNACFYLPDLQPGEPVVFPGQCEDLPVVQNFDAARYLGRWRMIESYTSEFQSGSCNEADYSLASDGSVDVLNTQVVEEALLSVTGSAVLETPGVGKLLVTFPDSPAGQSTYWILDTDYDSYSLVYSCRNVDSKQRRVWAWKLSRDRSLSDVAKENIKSKVEQFDVLNDRYFNLVQQSDAACFYYPEPNGKPVTFRGQCDESVGVVTDFNVERYGGTWYDIESYPQEFQGGTCPSAQYDLAGDVVSVVNSQVVAQELDVVKASARFAGASNEGKLVVTFPPIPGSNVPIEVPYWILATDYDSYSLVYSCTNVGDEYRRVSSWKLSRSQSLSTESSTAIAAVVNQVPVLSQQYFEAKDHGEEACFFYPDNNGGPVIMDGQCNAEELVNAVPNFDPARFAGTWHEISRFPNELQVGACAANEYSFSGGALSVSMSIVNGDALIKLEGPVDLSEDGRGVLDVNLGSGSAAVRGKMYVLDVDYENHALMYSCRNIDNAQMQVYSWKLSRSRAGLSELSKMIIDEIVNKERNLFFRYYEDTAQDNDACFYYPEFATLPDSIVLPGPCNPNIRGIPSFDAQRYLGEWYEIQKYPQPFQGGECGRAHYSLGDSAVRVVNTQVIDRALLSQEGTAVASEDGLGELTVTFDVNGVTNVANYFIMATDYDNYALVYSCRTLDSGDRQVSSWKLSRSSALSSAANTAIDAAVASTQGLLQDYYTNTDQSLEACFYVPQVDPEKAVLFRGTCDNINGQAGFDMSRYQGWWHEISSYSTGEEAGTCRSSQYQQAGGQVEFVDTQVFDLKGDLAKGSVDASSNGRLRRTFSDGRVQDIWVLATDYNEYAVVFSCEQFNSEYVKVWSSLQSKSRALTTGAEEAIEAVIANNDYLSKDLFLTVDQSDESCFYYPETVGPRVRLPGQCDESIPTQSDFDIVRYSGVWYQVERYPYPEVSPDSTCIGTRYTHDAESGEVQVVNWEVRDGELNSIEGRAEVDVAAAKLDVVLPAPDSDEESRTNLYILDTDYASYALAYTCYNVNQFEREVVAFKLSRTRHLPEAASAAINTYMASRQELHQPYFLEVEQNEDCEEPNSSFLVRSSLVVLLVCYVIQLLV